MTSCAGRKIRKIVLDIRRSPPRVQVQCHQDWYGFLRKEALRLGYKELTATQALLESSTDLKHYDPNPFAALHAEMNLAMNRKIMGELSRGEIGVSKSCCATCTEGLSALRNLGYQPMVKSVHNKPYVAMLADFRHVDKAVVNRIQIDFENWLRTIIIASDSDVSDHETAVPDSDDAAELDEVEITSIGEVDELGEESFD